MNNVWITGAAGFIGSHLVARFVGSSRPVCGLDYLPRPEDLKHNGVSDWLAGAIDFTSLDDLAKRQGVPTTVYHLAGGGSVGASFADPYNDFVSSVGGTAILLEWLRINAPAARLVYVSSAAVYGDSHDCPIHEAASKNPYSPYGSHKFASEQLCLSAAENFGQPLSIVRPFSIYGEGLRKQLLWDCCGRLAQNPKELALGGTGKEQRDWLHVSDLCQILEHAGGASGPDPLIINAASGSSISVHEVIETLCAIWDPSCTTVIDFSGMRRAGDPFSLIANVSALTPWNFAPSVPFAEGIARYVAWYKSVNGYKSL
jgi:UDP-glucose 4-epimerase